MIIRHVHVPWNARFTGDSLSCSPVSERIVPRTQMSESIAENRKAIRGQRTAAAHRRHAQPVDIGIRINRQFGNRGAVFSCEQERKTQNEPRDGRELVILKIRSHTSRIVTVPDRLAGRSAIDRLYMSPLRPELTAHSVKTEFGRSRLRGLDLASELSRVSYREKDPTAGPVEIDDRGSRFRVVRNTSSRVEGLRCQCKAFRVGGAVERSLAGHAEVVKGFAPESCSRSVLSQLRRRSGHGPVLEGCQDTRMDRAATTLQ